MIQAFIAAAVLAVALTSCSSAGSAVKCYASIAPDIIEGPKAERVLNLLQAADCENSIKIRQSITNVVFASSETGVVTKRPARPDDIPGTSRTLYGHSCKIFVVLGLKDSVAAGWSCEMSHVELFREFLFEGDKLVLIRDFTDD